MDTRNDCVEMVAPFKHNYQVFGGGNILPVKIQGANNKKNKGGQIDTAHLRSFQPN